MINIQLKLAQMTKQDFDLLSLPLSVLCDVFSARLVEKDLVRLDSANCNSHRRDLWIQILKSNSFVLKNLINITNEKILQWLQKRRIKASSILFRFDQQSLSLSEYLRFSGSSVRTAHFTRGDMDRSMHLVGQFCKGLVILKASRRIKLTIGFKDLLQCNPNIQEIWLKNVVCSVAGIFDDLSLHKLRLFCIVDSNCAEGSLWSKTAFSNTLYTVMWGDTKVNTSDLQALFSNCPNLRGLSVHKSHLPSKCFECLGGFGSQLYNLSVWGNHNITDTDVLSLSTHFTDLRTLDIQDCNSLTNQSVLYIAEHCGSTLKRLHIDIREPDDPETERILELFSQKCTVLQYLNVHTIDAILCDGKGTCLLVYGCPQLRTLVVHEQNTICASSREFIRRMRPQLAILMHDATAYKI